MTELALQRLKAAGWTGNIWTIEKFEYYGQVF